MKRSDIADLVRLEDRLATCERERAGWAAATLLGIAIVREMNAGLNTPCISVDGQMQSAIIQAVCAEYDRRIDEIKVEMAKLGVTFERTPSMCDGPGEHEVVMQAIREG